MHSTTVGVGATPADAAADHRRKSTPHDGSHTSCYPCQQARMRAAAAATPTRRGFTARPAVPGCDR